MNLRHYVRNVLLVASFATSAFAIAAEVAVPQSPWRPEKPIEIVVPTGAAGINDSNARLIQKTMQEQRLASLPVLVQNKPGGNQSLAVVYLNQHAGDPHYVLYGTATVFTNQLAGITPLSYKDLTPLALLLVDYTVVTVKADSPIKTMRDMVERLKTDPDSVSFGVVARGGPNHLAVAQAMRSAGVDPKKLKLVVFKTNAESVMAVIGGHVHAMVSSVSAALPQVQAGNARMLAVAAPQRLGGSLANLPTMREQGIEATGISNWRVIFGSKGINARQVAFWQDTLANVVTAPAWKQQLSDNNLESRFMRGAELSRWLDNEYAATRGVMSDLALIKQ